VSKTRCSKENQSWAQEIAVRLEPSGCCDWLSAQSRSELAQSLHRQESDWSVFHLAGLVESEMLGAPMQSTERNEESVAPGGAAFGLTHWSVVLAAGKVDSPHAHEALEKLCQTYWPPIYAFVRRQGYNPHDAQDLTQGFFARLLEKNSFADADRSKGRFRSFLLGALKHFLANEWDRANAQKRGGGRTIVPIDVESAETSCGFEPADTLTAEKVFERRWALTLLDQVLRRLRQEYTDDGKEHVFDQLKQTLTEASRSVPYAEIAARLNTTEGAIKVAVHRLRQRYRELLRSEIGGTVASPDQVDDEIRNLFSALAG
jgi:RNA polymerase sigma-70 factor (ECF subfamily)